MCLQSVIIIFAAMVELPAQILLKYLCATVEAAKKLLG
jgi:hypothetical protein